MAKTVEYEIVHRSLAEAVDEMIAGNPQNLNSYRQDMTEVRLGILEEFRVETDELERAVLAEELAEARMSESNLEVRAIAALERHHLEQMRITAAESNRLASAANISANGLRWATYVLAFATVALIVPRSARHSSQKVDAHRGWHSSASCVQSILKRNPRLDRRDHRARVHAHRLIRVTPHAAQ